MQRYRAGAGGGVVVGKQQVQVCGPNAVSIAVNRDVAGICDVHSRHATGDRVHRRCRLTAAVGVFRRRSGRVERRVTVDQIIAATAFDGVAAGFAGQCIVTNCSAD